MPDEYEIVFSEEAQDQLIDLSPEDREQALALIAALRRNPYLGRPLRDDDEPLLPYLARVAVNWAKCQKRRLSLWLHT